MKIEELQAILDTESQHVTDALDKQIPKPIIHKYLESHKLTVAECPSCGWLFSFDGKVKHCQECGQALSSTDAKQSK